MSTTPVTPARQAVTFDVDQFDSSVEAHGIPLIRFRAMRCPVGLVDLHSSLRPGEHSHADCSNGFLYHRVGKLKALFTSNGSGQERQQVGNVDGSQAEVTFARRYMEGGPDGEPHVCMFDRFYLDTDKVQVTTWQLVEASPTGRDRLMYPAVHIEHVVGQSGDEFPESAYSIDKYGDVVWAHGRGPTYLADEERGEIFSIRYRYRPFYYVSRLGHQTRVAYGMCDGQRVVARMQQTASLSREYVFRNQENTDSNDQARQMPSPADGSFTAR